MDTSANILVKGASFINTENLLFPTEPLSLETHEPAKEGITILPTLGNMTVNFFGFQPPNNALHCNF